MHRTSRIQEWQQDRRRAALPAQLVLASLCTALASTAALAQAVQQRPQTASAQAAQPEKDDAASAQGNTLPTVTVTAESDGIADSAAGRYSTRSTPSGRLSQSAAQTPRAISIVPREVMRDQQVLQEAEAMRNVSSISLFNNYGGSYTGFNLRGIWASNLTSYLRNGTRWTHLIEPMGFNLERIEVIKGPNAIDYGLSTPGGFINYVTKQPLREPLRSASLTAGSHRLGKLEADLSGPIDAQRTLRYRLTGGYERGGAFTDHENPQRKGLAAALAWDATPDTKLDFSLEHNRVSVLSNPGLPVPDPQDIGSADRIRLGGFYGEHTAPIDAQSTFTSAQLRHALNEQWMLRGHLGHNRFYREVALTTIAGLSDDRQHVVRRVYRLPRQMSYVTTAQLELRGNVRSGGISHEVLAGLDVVGYSGGWSETAYFFLPLISVDAPQAGHFQLPDVDRAVMRGRWQGRGFFIQDVMDFGNGWGLQAGLRHERMRNQPAQATSVERMRHNSPNASLTFKPTAGSMLYLSYASSFEPNWSVQLFSGAKAGPSRGKQWELGAKQTWLDGRLNTSAALYTLRKTNIATSDLDNPGYSLLTGEVRVRGLELEASAQPLPGLELTGQATFMSPKVVANSNASIVGKAPDGTARRAASLWASYRLPVDAGRWRVGGGLFHSGRIAAGNNGLWFSPGYTTVDAMLGYRLNNHLNLRLNVKNLLDKRHYLRAYAGNSGFTAVVPGRPRSFVLTLDANF